MNIADLRQEYMRAGLSEAQADADPIRQFERWFEDALRAKLPLPNAMTLATVTPAGAPSARIVLLKGVEQGAFLFYTNYLSRKGRELEQRAQACLLLLWSDLERQVRIDGVAQKVTSTESDAYYATRPLGARLSTWASVQSATVATRKILEDAMEQARRQHGDQPPRPATWGGYRVVPQEIEFWQGRADRLHDRLRYRRKGDLWAIERLSP